MILGFSDKSWQEMHVLWRTIVSLFIMKGNHDKYPQRTDPNTAVPRPDEDKYLFPNITLV